MARAAHRRPARVFAAWALPSIALLLALVASNQVALACGGGGSSSYRKPPRPGHQHQRVARQPLRQGSESQREAPEPQTP